MKVLINWLAKTNIFLYSVSLWALTLAIKALVHVIKYIFQIPDIQFRERLTDINTGVTIDLLIDTLLIAPVLETIIFQTLFFLAFIRFRINIWVIVLSSGIIFGLIHNYSVFYIIDATLIGFTFMYLYILRAEINNKPFISTVAAHLTMNLSATIAFLIAHYCKTTIAL